MVLVGAEPAGVPAVGPVQEYVTPPVEELPEMAMDEEAQLIVAVELAVEIFGIVVLATTGTNVFVLHPLTGSVTTNV